MRSLVALEILGRLPGQEPQIRLAAVVLNLGQGKQRLPAAIESLNRHIQKFGLMLDKAQNTALKAAYKNADDEPALRSQLALVIGSMNPPSALPVVARPFSSTRLDASCASQAEKKENNKLIYRFVRSPDPCERETINRSSGPTACRDCLGNRSADSAAAHTA